MDKSWSRYGTFARYRVGIVGTESDDRMIRTRTTASKESFRMRVEEGCIVTGAEVERRRMSDRLFYLRICGCILRVRTLATAKHKKRAENMIVHANGKAK